MLPWHRLGDRPQLPPGYITRAPKGMLTWVSVERMLRAARYLWIASISADQLAALARLLSLESPPRYVERLRRRSRCVVIPRASLGYG
jgi:hypothetical protein